MPKILVNCSYCNYEIYRYSNKENSKFFCDKNCKDSFMRGKTLLEIHGEEKANAIIQSLKEKMRGDNNPNFGNYWSEEQKKTRSIISKEIMENSDIRHKAGNANRGVKFSSERIQKMHGGRDRQSYSRPMSEETKLLIGKKSKEKWTQEYKEKHRLKMEESGYWVPLKFKSDYEIYFSLSDWNHSMYSLIEFDKTIEDKVRDHIIPRWVGYKFGIFPEILRHPLNCQIISRIENIKKGVYDKKVDIHMWADLTYYLLCDIISYENEWHEQQLSIDMCHSYLNGERWLLRKTNNYG